MRGIKIPQYEFVLKIQGGGLCTRGGAYLRDTTVTVFQQKLNLHIGIEPEIKHGVTNDSSDKAGFIMTDLGRQTSYVRRCSKIYIKALILPEVCNCFEISHGIYAMNRYS